MDDDPEDLFGHLSPEGRRLAPVSYRFLRSSPIGAATITRLVESKPYRADGYVCWMFRKPISRCCGQDE
jgi:hypothetical protein